MTKFLVWVEIEEVTDEHDHVEDHSLALNGSYLAEFDTLDEAVSFGNTVQGMSTLDDAIDFLTG